VSDDQHEVSSPATEPTRVLDAAGHDVTDSVVRPVVTAVTPPAVSDAARTLAQTAPQTPPPLSGFGGGFAGAPLDATAATTRLPDTTATAPLAPGDADAQPTTPFAPFRPSGTEPTAVLPVPAPPVATTAPIPSVPDDARIREAEREARERMLGTVATTNADTEVPPLTRHDNDKFVGSFGLFWLRLVTAAVVGVRGVQMLLHPQKTTDWLTGLSMPYPDIAMWAGAILLLVAGVFLIIGFGTRTWAVIVAIYAIAMLTFVRWGAFSPFSDAPEGGFIGDFELLLAGVGIALAFLGAGGWSIDGHRRLLKAKRKLYN